MNNCRQNYYRPPVTQVHSQCGDARVPSPARAVEADATRTGACCKLDYDYETYQDMPGFPLAMAYVPWQPWCNLYCPEQALYKGTLFQELDLDFMGRRCN